MRKNKGTILAGNRFDKQLCSCACTSALSRRRAQRNWMCCHFVHTTNSRSWENVAIPTSSSETGNSTSFILRTRQESLVFADATSWAVHNWTALQSPEDYIDLPSTIQHASCFSVARNSSCVAKYLHIRIHSIQMQRVISIFLSVKFPVRLSLAWSVSCMPTI